MNNLGRHNLAERELQRICSAVPESKRAHWTQREYIDEIKRANGSLVGWLSRKSGQEVFFRKQRVIPIPPPHVHTPYSEPSLDTIVEEKRKAWLPVRGELTPMRLHKAQLHVEPGYQRNSVNPLKVDQIAAAFDLVVFGSLTVANREGAGVFYIVDGQNRWMAAQRRAEINELLCNVFESHGMEHEARVFAAINMARSGVSPMDKHRALVTGREPVAVWLEDMLETLGIQVVARGAKAPNQLSAIGFVYAMALRDKQRCEVVMSLIQDLTAEFRIEADLLKALDYLDRRIDGGIENQTLRTRLMKIGCHRLTEVLSVARSASTGTRQLGAAVLGEVNKGLPEHKRIVLLEV